MVIILKLGFLQYTNKYIFSCIGIEKKKKLVLLFFFIRQDFFATFYKLMVKKYGN